MVAKSESMNGLGHRVHSSTNPKSSPPSMPLRTKTTCATTTPTGSRQNLWWQRGTTRAVCPRRRHFSWHKAAESSVSTTPAAPSMAFRINEREKKKTVTGYDTATLPAATVNQPSHGVQRHFLNSGRAFSIFPIPSPTEDPRNFYFQPQG